MRILFESISRFVILINWLLIMSTATTLDTMLDPICQAKCLRTFRDSMKNSDSWLNIVRKPFKIESFCLSHDNCKGCIMGCGKATLSLENCSIYCKTIPSEYQESCSSSCHFLNDKRINRPGVCPEYHKKTKCSYACSADSECFKQGTKCCYSKHCNSTCQIAELPKYGVPPIPVPPLVRQIYKDKSPDEIHFELDWSSYNISSVDYPVLFVVQIRMGHLNEASNTVFDRWRYLTATSKSGVEISEIYLETWYQFRILAFSENGFKDVGKMTLPITVNYKPSIPAPPKNISEKVTRIINGKISVTIGWQPGESNSLLAISNYKISWKRVYELNEDNPLVTEYEISIPVTETQYTIENLLPSASYVVKIVSIVVYKDEKFVSVATVHYISTASIPPHKQFIESINPNEHNIPCVCGHSNSILPVDINNSTTVKRQLAMKIKMKKDIEFDNTFAPYTFRIQWQPMACIESQLNINTYPAGDEVQTIFAKTTIDHYLTGLRFHCNYRIEIELFSQLAKKIIKIWEGCFCTPNCIAHYSIGKSQSPCPNPDQHMSSWNHQLKVILKKSSNRSNTDAELHWNSESSYPVTSFRITWGPRLEEPIDEEMYGKDFMPLLDSGKALSKVVNYPIQKSILKDLHVGKIYIVKLQTIDHYSASRESLIFFKVHSGESKLEIKKSNSSANPRYSNYLLNILFLFVGLYNI